jgi:hypothetical protein
MSNDETVILSEQDEADLARLHSEPDGIPNPVQHTVLEVWAHTLAPAEQLAKQPVSPQYASKMLQSYPGLTYASTQQVHDRYFEMNAVLRGILEAEIATDDECLTYLDDPLLDKVENSKHYRNIIRDWQLQFLRWELEWDCASDDAAVELAALGETHKMFFGDQGLLPFLESIKFEYTEDDQRQMYEALEELRVQLTEERSE